MTETQLPAPMISVCVAHSPSPRKVIEHQINLPSGATVYAAISQCGLQASLVITEGQCGNVGVWGQTVTLDAVLQANDRVEIYRPLLVDPKVARRERFAKQGVKKSGLFAKRRPGAKPGY